MSLYVQIESDRHAFTTAIGWLTKPGDAAKAIIDPYRW